MINEKAVRIEDLLWHTTVVLAYCFVPKSINFQWQMVQEIEIKFINQQLKIGLADWRNVFLLSPLTMLNVEMHKGMLVYRAKGSSKRFTYQQVKKGLIRKKMMIRQHLPF